MSQKLRCEVTNIIHHGERVYSVFLKPDTFVPRFLPGQFLHLALDPYYPGNFWPESRVFSIASSPLERNLLRITYAVKGQFTGRMESELKVGHEVWIKLPYGEFTINSESDVCLLAGGTGITAFTAFVDNLRSDHSHQVHLFYGVRRPELLVYRSMVMTAQERCPNLHAQFFVEQFGEADCIPGRIDLKLVWDKLPDPLANRYYLAGPPEMLRYFSEGLSQRGVTVNHILVDAWE